MIQTNDNVIKLVEAIARETIARLAGNEKSAANCLILIPSYLTDPASFQSQMAGKTETAILTVVHSGQCDLSIFPLNSKLVNTAEDIQKKTVITNLSSFDEILCLEPPLSLLEKTLAADDSDFYSYILIQAALREIPVHMKMGFSRADRKKGVFFEKVRGLIDGIEDMGFRVTFLEKRSKTGTPENFGKSLISEEDVVYQHNQGSRTIKAGRNTIVTPLARDKIRELGIVLELA